MIKMWVLLSYREHDEEVDVHGIYSSESEAQIAKDKVPKRRRKITYFLEFDVDVEPVDVNNGVNLD